MSNGKTTREPGSIVIRGKRFEESLSAQKIAERVSEMGTAIAKENDDRNFLVLVVLKGAFVFAADLLRSMDIDAEVEFISISSYDGTESSGRVRFHDVIDPSRLFGRTVLVVEDIIETGRTLEALRDRLLKAGARHVLVAALLHKPGKTEIEITPDYIGFEIPDAFVIGYGMDYEQEGRTLASIYKLSDV